MLESGAWPSNFEYLTCEDYDGNNTPERSTDLKSFFIGVKEPTSYGGSFSFPTDGTPFNGHSFQKFKMEMSVASIQNGVSVNKKQLGSWSSGLREPILANSIEEMKEYAAALVYRVVTVVVSISFYDLLSNNVIFTIHFAATSVYNARRKFGERF